MSFFKPLLSLKRYLLRKKTAERDLDAELRAHLDLLTEEKLRAGFSSEDAHRAARIELGGIEQVKEEVRSARPGFWLEMLWQDLRFAARMLRKNSGFSAVVVLTLALGIGANTAVFSVADVIFFQPVPSVKEPERLKVVHEILPDGSCCAIPPKSYQELKLDRQLFVQTAAYTWTEASLTGDPLPERIEGAKISAEFFQMFGARFARGRDFLPEEFQPGRPVAILSYGFWQTHFGGDQKIVGRALRLNDAQTTIVGVTASDFDFPAGMQFWMPLAMSAEDWNRTSPGQLHMLGMLPPDGTESRAQSEATVIAARLEGEYPPTGRKLILQLLSFRVQVNGNLTPIFTMTLMGAAAFFLLIACTNVANLLLARGLARRREITLRAALGARPGRVMRQLLTEIVLLAVLGALLGLLFAKMGLVLLASGMPAETARQIAGWSRMGLDQRSLLFGSSVTLLVALLCGVVPAIQSARPKLSECLKAGGATSSSELGSRKLRSAFVCAQIALALVLLVGGGLMVKGFANMLGDARSFEPKTLLTVHVDLRGPRYEDAQRRRAFFAQALQRLSAMPGVISASLFTTPPLSNNDTIWCDFSISGQPTREHEHHTVLQNVSPNFFQTMHLALREGRELTDGDSESSMPVAVVSEKLARLYWPGKHSVGEHIKLGLPDSKQPWLTIAGVVSDVEYDWTDNAPEKAIYVPYRQAPPTFTYIALRTTGDPRGLTDAVRHQLAGLDPALIVSDARTLERLLFGSLGGPLEIGGMMAALGFIGLCVATVGVYGVMAYVVSQRTQEIGIRMVLGASRTAILRHMLAHGTWLALIGTGIGLAGAVLLTRLVSGFFYGVQPTDAATFVTMSLLLTVAALVACYIPARRATRVDPMVALRYE